MAGIRHDDIRSELLSDLTEDGRRQYEAFSAVHEARQVTARLAELREAANLSQRQAAKRAGIDQADLSRIESGRVTPSLPTLLRLLDVVGGTLIVAGQRPARSAPEGSLRRSQPRQPAASSGRAAGVKRASARVGVASAVKAAPGS